MDTLFTPKCKGISLNYLITGCAGFIGHALTKSLLQKGNAVLGIDRLSNYYSIALKNYRLQELQQFHNFKFLQSEIKSDNLVSKVVQFSPEIVVHLAAQAGIRLPIEKYDQYVNDNLVNFFSLTDLIAIVKPRLFLYASSSSVYGNSQNFPLSENQIKLKPTSFYGMTKLINEFHAKKFFSDKDIKNIGLRFFTVYGPYGRPDMAVLKLINCALSGTEFDLYGDGSVLRDFTYINDIVNLLEKIMAKSQKNIQKMPAVLNLGGGQPHTMLELIDYVESIIGKKILIKKFESNVNDMKKTEADFTNLQEFLGQKPEINFRSGLDMTLNWIISNKLEDSLNDWIHNCD